MQFFDYLRLGWANIASHKKRALIVVVIAGVLFGVLMVGSLLIRGIENAALGEVLYSKDGKVMVRTVAQQNFCEDECDIVMDKAEIRRTIAEYGGEEISVGTLAGTMNMIYVVTPDLVQDMIEISLDKVPDGVIPVLASTSTLANWLMIPTPDKRASGEGWVRGVERIRAESLGKVIESGGQKYFVVGILPGGFGVSSLSFEVLRDYKNPLNMLLGSVATGNSETLALNGGELEVQSTDEVWAMFPDLPKAQEYINNIATHNCNLLERRQGYCPRVKELLATTVIGDPVATYDNFEQIWNVFKIFAIVLSVIGCVVAFSTYTRLVGRDAKVIALYHAMGATKWQIVGVYCTYLLGLSLLAGMFSLILAAGMVLIINLLSMTKLTQIFVIGFGAKETMIWLFGWSNWILLFVSLLLMVPLVCVLLNLRKFSSKKLAQKMK